MASLSVTKAGIRKPEPGLKPSEGLSESAVSELQAQLREQQEALAVAQAAAAHELKLRQHYVRNFIKCALTRITSDQIARAVDRFSIDIASEADCQLVDMHKEGEMVHMLFKLGKPKFGHPGDLVDWMGLGDHSMNVVFSWPGLLAARTADNLGAVTLKGGVCDAEFIRIVNRVLLHLRNLGVMDLPDIK